MSPAPTFVDENTLLVGSSRFVYEYPLRRVPPGCFGIEKSKTLLQSYFDLWEELHPHRVVELGVRRGGSAVLFHELGGLARLVSIELSTDRVAELDRFIAERSLEAVLRPRYGIDQADRGALRDIVTEEFGASELDLVVDDASHLYGPSRASFEVLFPRLRPGGVYLLEDWSWQHVFAPTNLESRPDKSPSFL